MLVTKIESRDNPRVKHVRRVRDGRVHQQIYIEGMRLAEEAVRSRVEIEGLFCSRTFVDSDRKRDLLESVSQQCRGLYELPDRLFSSIAETKTAQGIVLIGRRPDADVATFEQKCDLNTKALPVVVMLTEVNNPSNLGAVLRTAEAAGAAGLIVSRNSTDPFSAKALRSAMGSAFRLPIWYQADENEVLEWARRKSLEIIAATGNGESEYSSVEWTKPALLIFGSEAHGLDSNVIKAATTVRIPMSEPVESLNLAVSAGVILFEARRQNDKRPRGRL